MNWVITIRNVLLSAVVAYLMTVTCYAFIAWDWDIRAADPGWWPTHYRLFTMVIFLLVFAVPPTRSPRLFA